LAPGCLRSRIDVRKRLIKKQKQNPLFENVECVCHDCSIVFFKKIAQFAFSPLL